ncbi:HypC/HybG/HupF family hydrogenase formation chaperone [Nonomuraea sp. LPB2021202275-12-8]|uniref:HypC/HybG/HupF family hydrogenase formation chaperone n=1 Tax=Nonomuraea sp. LPB2021202275-12-8 TaxID=3120159 RepID=UPI00300C02A0
MDQHAPTTSPLDRAAAARTVPGRALADDADRVAAAARDMAARFRHGGRLLTFGSAADAGHVAVEFTHPVIVGKRALPALSLANDAGPITGPLTGGAGSPAARLRLLGRPGDIAMAILTGAPCPGALDTLRAARELGLLTVALTAGGGMAAEVDADHVLAARSGDPLIAREIHITTYHLLWELAHVFLETPGTDPPTPPGQPACRTDDTCLTCADTAVPARITELRPGRLALAALDAASGGEGDTEEISVALVEAQVGDMVLVHAKEAIAVLGGDTR